MWFEDFQDGRCGGNLGYWNRMVLAILNFYVILMPPIKFWLNPIHGFGGDVNGKIFKMVTVAAISDIRTKPF